MHPKVRDLYKRILVSGRDYPLGLDWVREKAKAEFRRRAHLDNELDVKRAVAYGRFMEREMRAITALKKYRTINARYKSSSDPI